MRVCHVNTYAHGGAAELVRRLHHGLIRASVDSRIRFGIGSPRSATEVQQEYCRTPIDRWCARVRYSAENRMLLRSQAQSYYSRLALHRKTLLPPGDATCDIVHLHWVNRWLDVRSFFGGLPQETAVVWTIHDMSPLAGGCFTDFGCHQLDAGCRICPLLRWPFNRFLAASELKRRTEALKGRHVAAVANSAASRLLLDRSPLWKEHLKTTILPGLDLSLFERVSKAEARRELGIREDVFLVGFVAGSVTDKNKGLSRFFDVTRSIRHALPQAEALVVGEGKTDHASWDVHVHAPGWLESSQQLNRAYSAMDVLLVTSRMESFGQVALEAQACGTPVWAFDVGGVRETVQPGVSGMLFPFGMTEPMAANVVACFRSGQLEMFGEAASKWVHSKFSGERMVAEYLDLYNGLVVSTRHGGPLS